MGAKPLRQVLSDWRVSYVPGVNQDDQRLGHEILAYPEIREALLHLRPQVTHIRPQAVYRLYKGDSLTPPDRLPSSQPAVQIPCLPPLVPASYSSLNSLLVFVKYLAQTTITLPHHPRVCTDIVLGVGTMVQDFPHILTSCPVTLLVSVPAVLSSLCLDLQAMRVFTVTAV